MFAWAAAGQEAFSHNLQFIGAVYIIVVDSMVLMQDDLTRSFLLAEGVLQAERDYNLPKHPELPEV